MRLKVRQGASAKVLELTDDSTLADLLSKLDGSVTEIKYGFPPKSVDLHSKSEKLTSLGIKSGEQLTVNQSALAKEGVDSSRQAQAKAESSRPLTRTAAKSNKTNDPPSIQSPYGFLRMQVIEDDNSCLFRAIGFCLVGPLDIMHEYRLLVAHAIKSDPQYSDAVLGRKKADYINWITQDNSWGGAIEQSILSQHFGVTIWSVDIQSGRVDKFNEGQQTFIVVLYSGIHYDAVFLSPFETETGVHDHDVRVFDESMASAIEPLVAEMAKRLRAQHYYTDVSGFQIKCKDCGKVLTGEKGAQEHAKTTGHVRFGEV